jgi:hypothetical protein
VLLAALAMSLGAAAWVFQDQLLEVMGMIRGALAP